MEKKSNIGPADLAGPLTSAEYRLIRKFCGLTKEDAMILHGVKNLRSIERWESGYSNISENASKTILEFNDEINKIVQNTIDLFIDITNKQGQAPDEIVLVAYDNETYPKYSDAAVERFPLNAHNALLIRTWQTLKDKGANVRILDFDEESYLDFLDRENLTHNSSSISTWAAGDK